MCVVGALAPGRHIKDPIGALNVERDVRADLRDAQRAASLVDPTERDPPAPAYTS
jgi:hypothetical protein